ncbi:MAG: sulfatase-like hydrolase/transferase [Gemmataceae bacterium]|nr:sulfatase-like hydrolase/transferase [Gemmataceae bacterium]
MTRETLLFSLALLVAAPAPALAQPARPNFVVVLADDLGYGDLGCFGNQAIKTPHLDRFASQGLRFTHCYSAGANCSPSRAGLMTGRTPTRVGVHNWIPMLSPMHLRGHEITIATLLRRAGYATALVGKWHLNGMFNLPGQPQPSDHGFDHWLATQNNALPNHRSPYNFVRNGIPMGELKGYSADIVAGEAIRWLKEARDPAKPFFLYVCFHEPHEPIATDAKFAELYASKDPSLRAHHGNVSQMDAAFGRLMAALQALNLDENTVVLFTSDNGPALTGVHPHGFTGGLRAKKGHLYEGGIRVPGIVRWPGKTKPGRTSDEPIGGVDVLPTLCEIAGIAPPKDRAIDGTSIVPLLTATGAGKPLERKTPLYWHFNAAQSKVKVALRQGDWMLLARLDGPETKPGADIRADDQKAIKSAGLAAFELYNLREDPAQKTDRAAADPERMRRMTGVLRKLYREVQDESPTWPAWTWSRYEQGRIVWPEYYRKKQTQSRRS